MAEITIGTPVAVCNAFPPLQIHFKYNAAHWIGTRQQLESEGFLPAGLQWPTARGQYTSVDVGRCRFIVQLAHARRQKAGQAPIYTVVHHGLGMEPIRYAILSKAKELQDLICYYTPQWQQLQADWGNARADASFQAFKHTLLGIKKRGRPRKS